MLDQRPPADHNNHRYEQLIPYLIYNSAEMKSILPLLLGTATAIGSYDSSWLPLVEMPLAAIDEMFGLLQFDPIGEDTSP